MYCCYHGVLDILLTDIIKKDAMDFSTSIQLAENGRARANIKEDKIRVMVIDVETEAFHYDDGTAYMVTGIYTKADGTADGSCVIV